jgi:NAD(P)-dependent dehydrogenase (short-subunit alcohol dehydrogenase family)
MSGGSSRRWTDMTQLLTSKTAIIYGAGGSLGSAVARTFAADGATVHLVGNATCGLII